MQRWLPFPLLTLALLGAWLLLNESIAMGTVLLGGAFAVFLSRYLLLLEIPRTRLRRLGAVVRLMFVVLAEIVRSNNAVARIILWRGRRQRSSGFVQIPLEMRNPYGLAALACIITATPGTLWVEYDSTRSIMLLHVLDLVDDEVWVKTIKERYEKELMEIFQ